MADLVRILLLSMHQQKDPRDEINARNLLKHLIDIGKDRAVEMAVLIHCEQVRKVAFLHFEHGVFDGRKFALNVVLLAKSQHLPPSRYWLS